MKLLILTLGALAALSCADGPSAGPDVQNALDVYAPGVRLGARITDSIRQAYQLVPVPYVGYVDSTYEGPDGFHGLAINLDAYVEDPRSHMPSWARIEGVSLTADSAAAAAAAEQRLRALLGANPEEHCYAGPPTRPHLRALYWAGTAERGVLLVIPRGSWEYVAPSATGQQRERDAALLTFGAQPVQLDIVTPEPCS
jgi:hypothetical protein